MNAYPNVFSLPPPEGEDRPGGEPSPVRKQSASTPDLERFLEDFISGREPQTTQWIRLASMVASQSFSCDVVIRVLRPKEKVASGNLPIDKLGVSIARKVGAKYSPGRLKRVEVRSGDAVPGPGEGQGAGEEYSFDKTFLPALARVLVIGDEETSESTFEAIRLAVTGQLPKAEVKLFTLYWLEQHFRSELLDNRYFLSSASPLSVLSRQANPHNTAERGAAVQAERSAPALLPLPESPAPAEPAAEVPSAPVMDAASLLASGLALAAEEETGPAQAEASVPAPAEDGVPEKLPSSVHNVSRAEKKRAAPQPSKSSARIPPWSALLVLGILVLGVGFVVVGSRTGMFASNAEPADALVVPAAAEMLAVEPPAVVSAPEPRVAAQVRPKGPQGIIAVPSAGLRVGPSLDAKALRKSVRNNERVTILRRKPSNAGPDWVQIETKSGTVGWVWSSVVREVRKR
jgi:hypothetical protein